MEPIRVYIQKTHKISPFAQKVLPSITPSKTSHCSSLWASDIGPEVAFLLQGKSGETTKNLLALYQQNLVKSMATIWKSIEKNTDKLGVSLEDMKAMVFGGWTNTPFNKQSEDSQNLFFGMLEECEKRNIPCSAIGLKSPEKCNDTFYASPETAYIFNDEIKDIYTAPKLEDYSAEEVERLLSQRYDYVEISPVHKMHAGPRLEFVKD